LIIEYYLIARITSAYDRKGFVKIRSYSDFPERFFRLKKVYIDFFGNKKEFNIEKVKQVKDEVKLKFKNFDNEEDVEVLIGKDIARTASVQITDPATVATYIADGEILILDQNDAPLTPGDTVLDSPTIKIVQGRGTVQERLLFSQKKRLSG